MFDRRNMTSGGVGMPVHKFEGHSAAVLCVQVNGDFESKIPVVNIPSF